MDYYIIRSNEHFDERKTYENEVKGWYLNVQLKYKYNKYMLAGHNGMGTQWDIMLPTAPSQPSP